ncbi:ABC transporter ATP-binding protein [Thermococcus profundus]|uniref:ABC transporter ATP-binding protein n=1 Tax=Thermococcus profundus TaxID=49899 RepID=A0A2Z2MER8_THEPR|nr:ABC transporter ATP-binding protein [Thermococcus profundus]ASJ02414.1 ABC transporter ATP-binding protein [Thermococcus profundus]
MIEFIDVSYRYPDGTEALKNVSLSIGKGVTALLGPNGSGKTTLALHMNGILKPTKGTVLVNGTDTRKAKAAELSKVVGYVFQNPERMFFEETVLREAAFGPSNLQLPREEVLERAFSALRALGLDGYEERNPLSLSGGEQKRLAIASVLAMDPEYIVVDEPLAGLDWNGRTEVIHALRELAKRGRGVVVITHDAELALELAERIVLMDKGRMVFEGSVGEFLAMDLEKYGVKTPDFLRISRELGLGSVRSVSELLELLRGRTLG